MFKFTFQKPLTNDELEAILKKIEENGHDEPLLDLSNSTPTQEQFDRIIKIITTNLDIKILNLANTGLDDTKLKLLLTAVKSTAGSHLTNLYLDHNKLTFECCEAFRSFFHLNTTITTVTLRQNKLGNAGIIKFCTIISDILKPSLLEQKPGTSRFALETLILENNGEDAGCFRP